MLAQKKTLIGLMMAFGMSAVAPMAAADTWAFDGDPAVIEKLAAEKQAKDEAALETSEVYDNEVNSWSWDASVDKPRVYGRTYETYSFL
ncbi:hypothetical protein [Hydrogenovibrio halophilus]|uniref:hypothetical protein n=1 Tax=Hydrogenovibrio halophilus TaxID=373391 RepID=UPI00037A5869|nr:hypothetical protein [Hydrogenovibrio halophilus]